jgi:hypothetical protein
MDTSKYGYEGPKCSKCGYEGPGFRHVGFGDACDASREARECPKCGTINWFFNVEDRAKKTEKVKQLCEQIKKSLDAGNSEKAFKLREEALRLIDFVGGLNEESKFIAQLGEEARRWKREVLRKQSQEALNSILVGK